ncbi:hypothetical protein Gmet_2969 [Geobacter metallireducens GS-15]|uniref:Uncharacterized protein n=2 Tax=Geobacter metallireducens TaxID=28232 RepID=Q39RE0_GEOMG|nr:hypothetical protein Gmet_2969 [Geobacter metallireducens GS-15]
MLTTLIAVVTLSNMNAKLLLNERHIISENAFVEMVVWRVPSPLPGSAHGFKYRLALVVDEQCVLRYDNEAGKGDHKHLGEEEMPYSFTSPQDLLDDFWRDVDNRRF